MVWRGMAWYGMVRGRHAPMLLRGATNLDSAIVAAASSHIERLNLDFCSYEIFFVHDLARFCIRNCNCAILASYSYYLGKLCTPEKHNSDLDRYSY